MGYLGLGVVGFVVVLEQQAPQQLPHAQDISATSASFAFASRYRHVRLAAPCIDLDANPSRS
jgi:hypothetical protein